MKRYITEQLREWKYAEPRLPLLLAGARGVGKTYSVLNFSHSEFDNVIYLDLEADPTSRSVFSSAHSVEDVIKNITLHTGQAFDIRDTLLVLDEIQVCEGAYQFLESLCSAQGIIPYCVAITSYPTSGIFSMRNQLPTNLKQLTMGPMSFEEFCWANNKRSLVTAVFETYDQDKPFVLHQDASRLLYEYLLVGGLPAAVSAYAQSSQLAYVKTAQEGVMMHRIADITRYAPEGEAQKAFELYHALSPQLMEQNKKFTFTAIKPTARYSLYQKALQWLLDSGLVLKCTKVSEGIAPLADHTLETNFKLYQTDLGLLSFALSLGSDLVLRPDKVDTVISDALLENFMAIHFAFQGVPLYYWGAASRASVPFVLETHRDAASQPNVAVIPVELRSSLQARSRSLRSFIDRYKVTKALRVSPRNFSHLGTIREVPYYAAPMIGKRIFEH